MKKFLIGASLLLSPMFANAEITITTEILAGQTQYKIDSSIRREIQTYISEETYLSSLKADSFGFRLGVQFTGNFSFELSKHKHGESVNYVTVHIPILLPPSPEGISCCLGPDEDISLEAIVPIDLESVRLGVKGEVRLFENISINARLGFAHWKYDKFTPHKLTALSEQSTRGESGNNIYYSLGAEYSFTQNFYMGIEYSLLKISDNKTFHDELSGSYQNEVKDLSLVIGWEF